MGKSQRDDIIIDKRRKNGQNSERVTENNATPSELKNKKQPETYNPGTPSGLKTTQIDQVGLSPKPLQDKPLERGRGGASLKLKKVNKPTPNPSRRWKYSPPN
jgi:hypothetical protein